MRKSEIKLIVIELIAMLLFLLNIFIKNIFNEYTIIIPIVLMLFASLLVSSFEKEKVIEQKKIIKIVSFYTLSFLVIIYSIGLLTGYVKTSYSLKFTTIIKNLLPAILFIIVSELFRYHICKKGEKNKIVILLNIILFIFIDTSLSIHMYNLSNFSKIIELLTVVVFPSIIKNIVLTIFTQKYGYKVCIVYQLIMNVYLYIMPIFPNLSIYLESVIMVLVPLLIGLVVYLRFNNNDDDKTVVKNKSVFQKIVISIILFVTLITIGLYSNLFSYTVAVVGSGSMTPTIKIGDIILINKTYKNKPNKLKVGDVLVFKIKDKMYTHRIVEINKEKGKYLISTKGDRKGQAKDAWTVKNTDIVGVVKTKIPKLGYPSVWLNKLMEA